jgi:hypothetical protein
MKNRVFKNLMVEDAPRRLWMFLSVSILLHAVFLQILVNLPVHPPAERRIIQPESAPGDARFFNRDETPESPGNREATDPRDRESDGRLVSRPSSAETADRPAAATAADPPLGGEIRVAAVRGTGLQGRITTSRGQTVPGARVRILHTGTGVRHDAVSDPGGRFRLPGLLAGTYHVEIFSLGSQPAARREVTLPRGGSLFMDITLVPFHPRGGSTPAHGATENPDHTPLAAFDQSLAVFWERMKGWLGFGPSLKIHIGLQQTAGAMRRILSGCRFLLAGLENLVSN